MASASEARKLFEDGVNPDFPLTAKIHNKYGPVVSDVRKPLPNGSQQIVGYQTRFKFYPRGQLHAGLALVSCRAHTRGAKTPNLMR